MAEHLCSLAPATPLPARPMPVPVPIAPLAATPISARPVADWVTPKRILTAVLGAVALCLVVFRATHPDALAKLIASLACIGLCLIGLKMTFTEPTRTRLRPRRR